MNPFEKSLSRRSFLGQASCAAVGSASLFSTLFNLRMSSALAQSMPVVSPFGDYKALVCLFFAGGADSNNMLIPYGETEYSEYQTIRSDLALGRDTLLPINLQNGDGRQFAVHPGMPEVQQLFNNGQLAFINNVGTLVEPVTLDTWEAGMARVPEGLFSHSDQIQQWQTSIPDQRSTIGWAGRMADIMQAANTNDLISMNISLSGNNVMQSGNHVISYSIDSETGAAGINHYGSDEWWGTVRTPAINSLIDYEYKNIFEQAYASQVRQSIDASVQFGDALSQAPTLQTTFSDNEISQSFRTIAQSISVAGLLGMTRQTYFVLFGGWDHHDEVINNQARMLPVVSAALGEFNAAMAELDMQNSVTTFTASDFARTLTSNGRGSDHAWGGSHMVMGGAVNGSNFYGPYPNLYAGNPLDTGRGRLIPTTSTDEYFAELALWFGVPNSEITNIFPNLSRFYDPNSAQLPLGFLNV